MFLTKFIRKDGNPDEDYFYPTPEEAANHMALFVYDDSNLYSKIVVSDEDTGKVLNTLEFDNMGNAVNLSFFWRVKG